MYGLIHELKRVFEHVLLQVDASEVVHTTAELLTVLELVKDLSDFVVVEEGLIIITNIERVPRHLDRLREVTERQVKYIDLIVSWLVVEHDVEFFAFAVDLVLVGLLLLNELHLLFLMAINDQLDFLI